MSDGLPLPPHPNLEQYKMLAKDFQHACRSGDPGAIRDWAARWAETLVVFLVLPALADRFDAQVLRYVARSTY
jgi:hypothetical protein